MRWLEPISGDGFLRETNSEIERDVPKKNEVIDFSENSRVILEKRYLRKGKNGELEESIEEMFERVSNAVAEPDSEYRDVEATKIEFYNLLSTKKFFPNSPTFTGAGTPLGQLAGCFVLPIKDDMGRHKSGIFSTLRNAALIQQTGGGNGFSFSNLRSAGMRVSKSGGKATGPIGFLKVYDSAFGEVAQGGVRRGANMAVLRVDHPDIREFIKCKSSEGNISNFNISVALTDVFMHAVENDMTYELIDPHLSEVVDTPRAREIFDLIVRYAHRNGEPGVLFVDTANKSNPLPHLHELEATNPCGEQWLGPYENCCLGSINLSRHCRGSGKLDWDLLRDTVISATRFLDNVVTVNAYVPEIPALEESAKNTRRIGLGFMGLADVMYKSGVRYGSERSFDYASQIVEYIRFHSMRESIKLAREREAFPAIDGSIYDPKDLKWLVPEPLVVYKNDFERPELDWEEIVDGIKQYGIRNAAQTTVAPTGTIATVAGVEGYGCEPVFALAYYRNVYQAAMDEDGLTLTYTSPLFSEALEKAGIEGDERKRVIDEVIEKGSCQHVKGLPEDIKNVFVVSSDITPEEHIKMQAAIQLFVDNSISKTCNFPENATEEDVAEVYKMGWKLGCKGLTVYVTGSRDEVVLETKETLARKDAAPVIPDSPQERSYKLTGTTYKMNTPQGSAYVTVNKDERDDPVEVFVNVGKAGSDVAALSEALGRALSGWIQASLNPLKTVKEMAKQLLGIGGFRSVGFGKARVGSIPDAIAKVLAEEFDFDVKINGNINVDDVNKTATVFSNADMCPDCGNSSLIKEEGCSKCYNCGYSVC